MLMNLVMSVRALLRINRQLKLYECHEKVKRGLGIKRMVLVLRLYKETSLILSLLFRELLAIILFLLKHL